MSFLLDTNAVSEWTKPRPNPGLIEWMESTDEDRVFISVITLAELRYECNSPCRPTSGGTLNESRREQSSVNAKLEHPILNQDP